MEDDHTVRLMAEPRRNEPYSNGGVPKKGGYKKTANGGESQDNDYDTEAKIEKEAEDLRSRRRKKITDTWDGFLQTSTLHGFHYIFDNKQTIRRFLWFSVLVVMTVIFFAEFKSSFQQFLSYPFSTATMTEYKVTLSFPVITICNLNDARELMFNPKNQTLRRELVEQNWTMSSKMTDLLDHLKKNKGNEMLFECLWGNMFENCTVDYVHMFFSLEGHMCFSINSGYRNYPSLKSENTGLKHGLKMTLNAMQYEYPTSIRQAGFRVILHDYEDIPILQQGFAASPGAVTFVEIQRQKIINLRKPYRTNCGGKTLKYYPTYARSKCFLEMLTDTLLDKCNCKAWFMPEKVNTTTCTINQTLNCIWPTWETFESSTSYYDCPVDCEAIQYKPKLSLANFLVHNLGNYNYGEERRLNLVPRIPMNDRKKRLRFLRENFVRLEFYYDELKVHSVEQTPSYDKYKLVGDIGGQLGLMLGASVVTILEFVDLFVLFLYYLLSNPKRNG